MAPSEYEKLEQQVYETVRKKAPVRLAALCPALGIGKSDTSRYREVQNMLRRLSAYKWRYMGGGKSTTYATPKFVCRKGRWEIWEPAPPDPNQLNYEEAKRLLLDARAKHEDVAVFCDAGWGGQKMIHSLMVDGCVVETEKKIQLQAVDQLRKEGILGGNILITYKARLMYPVLLPGEKDQSTLGDTLHRVRHPTPW